MHFEIIVEDQSGKQALDILVPKIVGSEHTYRIIPYKGIGHTPKNLKPKTDANKRILLDQLPRLLRGFGKSLKEYQSAVIVVCDLDKRCLKAFREELYAVLNACNPKPETRFCIAVEEWEAWFLGDIPAIKSAYPKAKDKVLESYKNDSICGTWQVLADAVFPGGSNVLSGNGWQAIGSEKHKWSENITPHMDVNNNKSHSFIYFREKLTDLLRIEKE